MLNICLEIRTMENIEYNTILQSAEALLLYFLGFTKRISHRDYHDSFLCPLSLHAEEASRMKKANAV